MSPELMILVGLLLIGFGAFTFVKHMRQDSRGFSKLEPMRNLYGPVGGTAVHVLGYSVVPVSLGCYFLYVAFRVLDWL